MTSNIKEVHFICLGQFKGTFLLRQKLTLLQNLYIFYLYSILLPLFRLSPFFFLFYSLTVDIYKLMKLLISWFFVAEKIDFLFLQKCIVYWILLDLFLFTILQNISVKAEILFKVAPMFSIISWDVSLSRMFSILSFLYSSLYLSKDVSNSSPMEQKIPIKLFTQLFHISLFTLIRLLFRFIVCFLC